MRDSNHSFPNLNRACVSISSSLYDRRAIDSPVATLPLLTSLQHLAYLTSTSPRIREILTVDGGLERLISIVGTCLDIAYPERARKPVVVASPSSSSSSSNGDAIAEASTSRSGADRKGKSAQRQQSISTPNNYNYIDEDIGSTTTRDALVPSSSSRSVPPPPSHTKRMVPFKSFSAYANYPFSFDSDSEDGSSGEHEYVHERNKDEKTAGSSASPSMQAAAQRAALRAHEREVRLLQAERQFYSDFVGEYKDLPALVHTYGFALQCLVNVGVRGSESIRTRTVEAGVLGVVARILGGFLEYRGEERDRRAKILGLVAQPQSQSQSQSQAQAQLPSSQTHHHHHLHHLHSSTQQNEEGDATVVVGSAAAAPPPVVERERDRERSQRHRERAERHHHHHHHHLNQQHHHSSSTHARAHSGDSDSTQTVTSSRSSRLGHRERQAAREAERERERERDAASASANANATGTTGTTTAATTPSSGVQVRITSATPLVAGMPASTVTPRVQQSSSTPASSRQQQQHHQQYFTPSAATAAAAAANRPGPVNVMTREQRAQHSLQELHASALLYAARSMPALALGEEHHRHTAASSGVPSALPSPSTPVNSNAATVTASAGGRRAVVGAPAPAAVVAVASSSSSSSVSSSSLPIAIPPSSSIASSLMAASIINRTNTPDTIASMDEIQEFSDVNPDENENESTSSGQENDDGMDVISETEQSSISTLSNPSSRSVSRNRINAAVLASIAAASGARSDSLSLPLPMGITSAHASRDDINASIAVAAVPVVQQPGSASMMGDVTIKLGGGRRRRHASTGTGPDESENGNDSDDIVMSDDRDAIEEDGTDTGASVSPISRPVSSQHMHGSDFPRAHAHRYQRSQLSEEPLSSHSLNLSHSSHSRQESGMNVDNELTPISQPQTLRRLSSNDVATMSSASGGSASGSASASAASFTSDMSLPSNAMGLAPPPVPVARSRSVDDHVASSRHASAVPQAPSVTINQTTTTPSEFLGHAAAVTSQLQSFLQSRSQSERRSTLTAANAHHQYHHQQQQQQQQVVEEAQSCSNTHAAPSSLHVHLRLHPHLQAQRTHGAVSASGAPLISYGPLMDHYMKEEDVLHCLHLLAYLSKYPHVRAVFHDPENEVCRLPSTSAAAAAENDGEGCASAEGQPQQQQQQQQQQHGSANKSGCCSCARKKLRSGDNGESSPAPPMDENNNASTSSATGAVSDTACRGRCHTHAQDENASTSSNHGNGNGHCRSASSGSQKHAHPCCDDDDNDNDNDNDEEAESLARARAMATMPAKDRKPALEPSRPPRSTANNVFSLVEQYTFRPSSPADRSMRLGTDVQYWAGVIMRNACRKDELRGGIRQCANMGCGVWERFPREFAKCRRCRKAKYCSKGCQRRAWQAGHRYWCSARQDAPPNQGASGGAVTHPQTGENVNMQLGGELADEAEDVTGRLDGGIGGGDITQVQVNPGAGGDLRTGIVDGITVGGEDGVVERADFEQRIRVGDAAGDMAMLDGM